MNDIPSPSVRVLLVDDDPAFGDLTARRLELEDDGLDVDTETDAETALDRLDGEIDCIVSDYQMPGTDGLEFLEAVREAYPDLPFVLFTGKGSEEIASEAISAGVTDYVQKNGNGQDQYTILANRIENAVDWYETESERRRWKQALETASEGVAIVDDDGGHVQVNESYAEIHGASLADMVETGWREWYPDEEIERFESEITPALRREGTWDGTAVGLRADGTRFDQELSVSRLSDGGHVRVLEDVTERTERERELRRLKQEYQIVFEQAEESLFLVDVEGADDPRFRLRHVNPANADVFGVSPADIQGKPVEDVFEAEQSEKIKANHRRCLEAGETISYEETLTIDGTQRVFETTLSPIEIDGNVTQIVGVAHDVTERERRQRELERRNDLFRKAQDIANVGAWEYDVRTGENTLTGEAYEIYDLPRDYVLTPEDGIEYYHPEDRDTIREAFETAVEDGEPYDVEVRLITAEGDQRWVRTRGDPQREDGEVVRVRGTIQDITERKEREKTLQLRERAMDEADIGITMADATRPDDPITYVNERFEQLTGYAESEVMGKNCRFLQGEDTDPETVATVREAIDAGQSVSVEVYNYRKDGTPFWNEVEITPIRDDDGAVTHYLGFQRDVTERKERERELRRVKERFRRVFEHSNDAILVTDMAEESFIEVNQAACEMLEYSREELLSMDPGDIHPDDADDVCEEFLSEVLASGSGWTDDLPCVTKHGEELPMEISAATLQAQEEGNHPSKTVAVLRDISDRVAYQRELERQNERLEKFASIVSHDLRNPLSLAEGYLKVFRETGDETMLEEIEDAHGRVRTIINDVLSVARDGQPVDAVEPVDLPRLIEEAWATVETAQAAVRTDDVPTAVPADADRLRRVFENLFRNAIEHAGEDVTVTVGGLPDGFYVADDGPGIPAEDRDDVFEWGYSTCEDGTGYGLAIVNELVEAHGWTITVTESETGGAQFDIRGVDGEISESRSGRVPL